MLFLQRDLTLMSRNRFATQGCHGRLESCMIVALIPLRYCIHTWERHSLTYALFACASVINYIHFCRYVYIYIHLCVCLFVFLANPEGISGVDILLISYSQRPVQNCFSSGEARPLAKPGESWRRHPNLSFLSGVSWQNWVPLATSRRLSVGGQFVQLVTGNSELAG